ncbi:MBOAT family O-acyltransferase [Gracilibacillus salinarum]|uniref:MBOAT family protein n=1 Tax=Gracilibacillus salinarum TaxID=2932255 RepID=A0ABY4GV32_9BACI|nr:MBOAT family O-acyltransferase [Gracilibacillus salinarum]UOQ87037.1 MBOAT family protein [Gracilibacillus salinarum]
MVFSNLVFLFGFLPMVLFCYYMMRIELKNYILLIASLVFYAWGEPKYIFLMIVSILINYVFGLLIDTNRTKLIRKKTFLICAIISNLLILGFFKYAQFLVDNINQLFNLHITIEEFPLPIGISFFTFQALSYIIDVYRHDTKVQRNLTSLALYIALFPQLIAGPIVRYNSINEQLEKRQITLDKFTDGIQRFIIGLSKKVLLANAFGEIADTVFATNTTELSVATAWIGVLAYSLQIYFDFSGYSDMAIGLGKMFGFDFPENFNYPYIARSVSEFWRRWHISLSTWFRDYVYIPLGGNRKGAVRTIVNLLIVWTLTGFWHGASWTFMAWGFYFGLLIVVERLGFSKVLAKAYRPLQHIYLLLVVMIGWVFFRADNFAYSFDYIQVLFGLGGDQLMNGTTIIFLNDYWIIFVLGIIFSMPIAKYLKVSLSSTLSETNKNRIRPIYSIVMPFVYMSLLGIVMISLVNSTYNPFIYFRF